MRNTKKPSITEHGINHNHDFDWSNVKILDTESYIQKRLISEMLYIKMQNNGLNFGH